MKSKEKDRRTATAFSMPRSLLLEIQHVADGFYCGNKSMAVQNLIDLGIKEFKKNGLTYE